MHGQSEEREMTDDASKDAILELMADVISAYVSNNVVPAKTVGTNSWIGGYRGPEASPRREMASACLNRAAADIVQVAGLPSMVSGSLARRGATVDCLARPPIRCRLIGNCSQHRCGRDEAQSRHSLEAHYGQRGARSTLESISADRSVTHWRKTIMLVAEGRRFLPEINT